MSCIVRFFTIISATWEAHKEKRDYVIFLLVAVTFWVAVTQLVESSKPVNFGLMQLIFALPYMNRVRELMQWVENWNNVWEKGESLNWYNYILKT